MIVPSPEVIELARQAWDRKGMKPLTTKQERIFTLIGKVPQRTPARAA